jgi:hypothetical protein
VKQKKIESYREERGKPEASIVAEIEEHLEKYHASRAAYHGGDFNGVSCRKIVSNAKKVCDEVREILLRKKMKNVMRQQLQKKL